MISLHPSDLSFPDLMHARYSFCGCSQSPKWSSGKLPLSGGVGARLRLAGVAIEERTGRRGERTARETRRDQSPTGGLSFRCVVCVHCVLRATPGLPQRPRRRRARHFMDEHELVEQEGTFDFSQIDSITPYTFSFPSSPLSLLLTGARRGWAVVEVLSSSGQSARSHRGDGTAHDRERRGAQRTTITRSR